MPIRALFGLCAKWWLSHHECAYCTTQVAAYVFPVLIRWYTFNIFGETNQFVVAITPVQVCVGTVFWKHTVVVLHPLKALPNTTNLVFVYQILFLYSVSLTYVIGSGLPLQLVYCCVSDSLGTRFAKRQNMNQFVYSVLYPCTTASDLTTRPNSIYRECYATPRLATWCYRANCLWQCFAFLCVSIALFEYLQCAIRAK